MPGAGTSLFFPNIVLTSHCGMNCRVETYSGFRLHERPRRFTWGRTWLEVDQVMDQWVAPGLLCFKVKVADRAYLLKYHHAQDIWKVGLARSGALPPPGGEN
jgi:hypothetical protein